MRKTREVNGSPSSCAELAERVFMFENLPEPREQRGRRFIITFNPFRIAFCGRMYNGVEVRRSKVRAESGALQIEFFYDAEALGKFIESAKLAEHSPYEIAYETKHSTRLMKFLAAPTPVRADFFEARCEAITLAASQSRHAPSLVFNPELQSRHFAKVLGPWEAFQELDMFFARLAAPESGPPMVIEDKYRIAQRGFDKFSFRKGPTKPRRRTGVPSA